MKSHTHKFSESFKEEAGTRYSGTGVSGSDWWQVIRSVAGMVACPLLFVSTFLCEVEMRARSLFES